MMSLDEFKLLIVLLLLFCAYTWVLRQSLRHTAVIFLLACLTGWIAQVPLGRELNLYTPNITIYLSYVSVAVIVTWGAGLTTIYAAHLWLARVLRIGAGARTIALSGIPILVALEFVGSNIIRMKLHDYRNYASLMPLLNSMNAPPWLYAYYVGTALLFFYALIRLGIHTEDWSRSVFRRGAGQPPRL
ncbi:MAG: hypothetical protein WCP29_17975 [Acidobacteriota bacterium]